MGWSKRGSVGNMCHVCSSLLGKATLGEAGNATNHLGLERCPHIAGIRWNSPLIHELKPSPPPSSRHATD